MKPRASALVPFVVFAVFYVGLSVCADRLGLPMPWYAVPMPIAFLVASVSAFLWGRRPLDEKVEIFAKGMGETNIMIMCLIFILAGAFATVAKGSGAVDAAVSIAQAFVPARLMVAGVFLVACVISTAIGTSCGTIAAVAPIALGFAAPLGISPALLLGAVVGGSMFGDNLSMISDTTIAATRTQGVRMKDKFIANFNLALPAAGLALVFYAFSGSSEGVVTASPLAWEHGLLILPYVLVLALALCGFNVMALLFLGTLLSSGIGLALGRFGLFGTVGVTGGEAAPGLLDLLGRGVVGMSETLIVSILAGGLFRLVQANGGIDWLVGRISSLIRGPRSCEAGVAVLVAAVNCFTANNTVAIVITGPIAKACSEKAKADPVRIASVLDTCSCIVQGVVPYGAQILIAIGVAKGVGLGVDAFSLIGSLYYQPLLALAVVVSIVISRRREAKGAV